MADIIKYPGTTVQVLKESKSLDELIDPAAIRREVLSAKDSAVVFENIDLIKSNLTTALEKIRAIEADQPFSYREAIIKRPEHSYVEVEDREVTIGFEKLKSIFEENNIRCPLSERELKYWRKLQKRKISSWFRRMTTRKFDIVENNDLDMRVDLSEAALQRLPGYREGFNIDRNKIVYCGNLQNLIAVLKAEPGNLHSVLETYPNDLINIAQPRSMTENTDVWLATQLGWDCYKQMKNNNDEFEFSFINDAPELRDKYGTSTLKFIFNLPGPRNEEDRINWSVPEQMKKTGVHFPTMGELIWFGMGYQKCQELPNLRKNIYYRIDGKRNLVCFIPGSRSEENLICLSEDEVIPPAPLVMI